MDKETIKALVKKEWDKALHPNINDDFELVWEIHEKYKPFNDCFFKPITFNDKINSLYIPYEITKNELIETLTDISNESKLYFSLDEDSDIEIAVYEKRKETETETIKRIYKLLIQWASTSDYRLIKKIFALEKENAELKKKLHQL